VSGSSASFSVTETRNALRCPRVFALGRMRGQQVMFPIGASSLGSVFHRLVAEFAREPGAARLERLPPAAPAADVADALAATLLLLLATELGRVPAYASMPSEVDDLAEALREFAHHVARSSLASGAAPAEAVRRFLAGAELPVAAEVERGEQLIRLTGRIDALHLPPGGAAEVVEYKLTDDANEDLDRAQVALYRFLLAGERELDAAPVILRFNPRLTITRLAAREADELVERQLLPLLADMAGWAVDPRTAPPTARGDLCAACPVRGACASLYSEPLAARDDPPAGALRPRPDPIGELREGDVASPAPAAPAAQPTGATAAEAERVVQLILSILRRQGVAQPTARPPVVGARLIEIEVSVARGSVSAIERAAGDVEHRLAADHGLTARFHRKGALRVFVIARAEPERVSLAGLLAARAGWLRERAGRFLLGETTQRAPLGGDLSDASSCHLLVGGQTGSGKSVLLRCIAASLVHFHSPAEVQLTLVDPKRVSFARLAAAVGAHLAGPLLHDVDEAIPVLASLIEEMEERYALFEAARVQDIDEYNELRAGGETLPRRVVLVDEFQDLVAVKATRERFIDIVQRLGSKARASGIHLVLATQRPTRENVPGGIKANLPGRVALSVASALESRIVLEGGGAEALLGKGDLLADLGRGRIRAQAPFDGP
jgi:S-DNA-T family DNA segregation ATPase FtsK/SpoIIIE